MADRVYRALSDDALREAVAWLDDNSYSFQVDGDEITVRTGVEMNAFLDTELGDHGCERVE